MPSGTSRRTARAEIYRFVVVYVCEGRETPGAPGIWRGHVTQVSDGLTVEAAPRIAFTQLDDLPGILRNLLTASGAPCPPASPPGERVDQNPHPRGGTTPPADGGDKANWRAY